jgi:hypothetical protein
MPTIFFLFALSTLRGNLAIRVRDVKYLAKRFSSHVSRKPWRSQFERVTLSLLEVSDLERMNYSPQRRGLP